MSHVVLFYNDFRLSDHSALNAAISQNRPLIPLYIHDDTGHNERTIGAASQWWLHHSLNALHNDLLKLKNQLFILKGDTLLCLKELHSKQKIEALYTHNSSNPQRRAILEDIQTFANENHINIHIINHPNTVDFLDIQNSQNSPFQVFTPFSKAYLATMSFGNPPLAAPTHIPNAPKDTPTISLDELKLRPKIKWDSGFYTTWTPGEKGAQKRANDFIAQHATDYNDTRNLPAIDGVSRLSPHLHFGEISIQQLSYQLDLSCHFSFFRQLIWNIFAQYILFHFPHSQKRALKPEWDQFPYTDNPAHFKAWCHGKTGYPMVDAGMRELWNTGYMHNRPRMVVASFLTKHLGISWKKGEEWFWDTLVDADLANNLMGWQWTAGCGADAAPYFRIFNPITQGSKFDEKAAYIRQWIPELTQCPKEFIFEPWQWKSTENHYPAPIVNHTNARDRAMTDYEYFKNLRSSLTSNRPNH